MIPQVLNCEKDFSDLVRVHNLVAYSKVPNAFGCKIPIYSKLNVEFIKVALLGYSDYQLCEFIKYGFPIGFVGESYTVSEVKNHSGARNFSDNMDRYIVKESSYGAILGPFVKNPFDTPMVLSPLNSVPKRDSLERRVILDLSFDNNGQGFAVNNGIDKDIYLEQKVSLSYPSVDDLVEIIKKKGKGCLLFKKDLKRAYRQFPIDPGDWNLVGFEWNNHIFFERVLSMGCRSSAHICQRVTNAVSYVMKVQYNVDIVNYLDDFAGGEVEENALKAYEQLGTLLSEFGLEESIEKSCLPSTSMVFLGVLFDTITCCLFVTAERLEEISLLIHEWLLKKKSSLKELQTLIGKLVFLSSCVRPGRLFVSRLLDWLRSFKDENKVVFIPKYVRKDLQWWNIFLPLYNGVSMMFLEDWSKPDEFVACDACLQGCGGLSTEEYFHTTFPSAILKQDLNINALELLTIVICLKLWAHKLKGKRLVVNCDNLASVTVLNTGACRNTFMQSCLREICFLCAINECQVRGRHIPGSENRIPDLLSRWNVEQNRSEFDRLTKQGVWFPVFVPNHYFEFSHDW